MGTNEHGDADRTPDPLPDDAIVIRGGVMTPRTMEVNAYTEYDETGVYALSVSSLPDADFDTIAAAARLPHGQVCVSTVGRIRAAGYEVRQSEPPPAHADLLLPNPPADEDWEALLVVFDAPIANPHRRVS